MIKKIIKYIIVRCGQYYENYKINAVCTKTKSAFGSIGENYSFGRNTEITGGEHIFIGDGFHTGHDCQLQAWGKYENISYNPKIIIGNDVVLTSRVQISCIDYIKIGDNCLFGNDVFISDNFHGNTEIADLNFPPLKRKLFSKGPIIIGDNVWIGRNACVFPGVTIGDMAIIGANAVVTKDIPPCSVAVGIPAKVIKFIS